jgi:phosphatidylserine/phosphatidylglycerophosphate/cardiolipin synthase-like enzyme
MSVEGKPELHLEIAHVLFMDVVGFSKLLITTRARYLSNLIDSSGRRRISEAEAVVTQLQATFATSWLRIRGEVLHSADYFPPLISTGPYLAQAIRSGAHNENLDLMYLLTIASAQRTLRIENAYFLPDDLMRKELTTAASRGVKVEVIVPGKKID